MATLVLYDLFKLVQLFRSLKFFFLFSIIFLFYPLVPSWAFYTGTLNQSLSSFSEALEKQRHHNKKPIVYLGTFTPRDEAQKYVYLKSTNSSEFVLYVFNYPRVAPRVPAYLLGRIEKDTLIFIGARVSPSLRGKGIFSGIMKFFFALAHDWDVRVETGVMRKPAFALFFSKLGFEFDPGDSLWVTEHPSALGPLYVFPESFEIEERLIQSQKLEIVPSIEDLIQKNREREIPSKGREQICQVQLNSRYYYKDPRALYEEKKVSEIPGSVQLLSPSFLKN